LRSYIIMMRPRRIGNFAEESATCTIGADWLCVGAMAALPKAQEREDEESRIAHVVAARSIPRQSIKMNLCCNSKPIHQQSRRVDDPTHRGSQNGLRDLRSNQSRSDCESGQAASQGPPAAY